MHFIYKITNDINNKLYIGKTSRTIQIRFHEHVKDSKKSYTNRPLYDAMNKYGAEHFHINIIDTCYTNEEASEKEIYWIEYYDSYRNGYNATLGGEGVTTLTLNDEEVVKKYKELKSKRAVGRYFQVDEKTIRTILNKYKINFNYKKQIVMMKDDKIIKVFNGRKDANRYLNINERATGISKALSHVQKTAYGYKWKYLEDVA